MGAVIAMYIANFAGMMRLSRGFSRSCSKRPLCETVPRGSVQQPELIQRPREDREHLNHGGLVQRVAGLVAGLGDASLGEEPGLRIACLVPGLVEVGAHGFAIARVGGDGVDFRFFIAAFVT